VITANSSLSFGIKILYSLNNYKYKLTYLGNKSTKLSLLCNTLTIATQNESEEHPTLIYFCGLIPTGNYEIVLVYTNGQKNQNEKISYRDFRST
jgi:hypothetical protein